MKYVFISRVLSLLSLLIFSTFFLVAQDTLIHYTETTGFDHRTRDQSLSLFEQIGTEQGFVVVSDNDGQTFTKSQLRQAKAVIFSNTSGNNGLNSAQQKALEWFVDTLGGHLMGIHAASDTYRHSSANGGGTGAWDWYAETLGGSVQTNPNHTSQNHVDTINRLQPHPTAGDINFPWIKEEEYYYWENGYLNQAHTTILEVARTGNETYDAPRPVVWVRELASGSKVFYTSLGHKRSNFTGSFPNFEQLLRNACAWFLSCSPSLFQFEAQICQGETYSFQGEELTQSGTYHDTLLNSAGCDSIITLDLLVEPNSMTLFEDQICQGETYSFQGEELTQSGTYRYTLLNAAGCDSIITLDLLVVPNSMTLFEEQICQGETYSFLGEELTQSGTYRDTLLNAAGCDSIISLDLSVEPTPTTMIIIDDNQLEAIDSHFNHQWLDCDQNLSPIPGATLSVFVPLESGRYAVVVESSAGCKDTSDCVEILLSHTEDMPVGPEIQIYPNPVADHLYIIAKGRMTEIEVSVYPLRGTRLMKRTFPISNPIKLDVHSWPAGSYFLVTKSGQGTHRHHFVKQ